MANEISEDSKFNISIKTLAWIIAGVSAIIAGYYGMISNIDSKFMELEIKVQEALELPKPGTGDSRGLHQRRERSFCRIRTSHS